jgi:hypothetical protein
LVLRLYEGVIRPDTIDNRSRFRMGWATLCRKVNRVRAFPVSLLGVILLLPVLSLAACAAESAITTRVSVEPDTISLSAREGENPGGESLEIYSSAEIDPHVWEAKDDALWLEVSPPWGTFDSGVSKAVVWVDTSGMSVGSHTASISIFLQEADNSPLTIPVRINVLPPEDPTVVAAREFWESSQYNNYWSSRSIADVYAAVRAYEFPGPYSKDDWDYSQKQSRVETKGCKFDYDPGKYARPVAIVYCKVFFEVRYDDPRPGYYRYEEWVSNLDVVLEVEPGPYSTDHNEWEVIDYYAYNEASSPLVKIGVYTVGDSVGCGCG